MLSVVTIPGLYSWVLICDIDNSTGGEYVKQHTIVTRTRVTKSITVEELKRSVSSSNIEFKTKLDAGGKFKILSVNSTSETTFNAHVEQVNQITSTEVNSEERETTETYQDTITVRAGEKFTLYQLQFSAPGIYQSYPITSTIPKEVPDIIITYNVEVEEVTRKKGILADGSTYALKSCHGNFISGHEGGESAGVNLASRVQAWEKWTFVHIRDDIYGLRSVHGTYLRGRDSAQVDLQVDKHNWDAMPWEQWTVVRANNNKFAFRSTHGTYMRAHKDRNVVDLQVDKHNWDAMPWEQFELVPVTMN